MIELFSRRPDFQVDKEDTYLTPLPIADDISSLSAIMLDENYYQLMLQGREVINGIPILKEEYLILFKVKAWLDLRKRKMQGSHVNEHDYKKHKNDVYKLAQIVSPMSRIQIPEAVAREMNEFIELMESGEAPNMQDLKIDTMQAADVPPLFRQVFVL